MNYNHVVFVTRFIENRNERPFFADAVLVTDKSILNAYSDIVNVDGPATHSRELPNVYKIGDFITVFAAGDARLPAENPLRCYSLERLRHHFGKDALILIHKPELYNDMDVDNNIRLVIPFRHLERYIDMMTSFDIDSNDESNIREHINTFLDQGGKVNNI